MNARVTLHSSAQEARALTPHHVNAFVMQIAPAHKVRHSITLHASVNVILSKYVVRAESLMRTHVGVRESIDSLPRIAIACFGMAECNRNLLQAANLLPLKNSTNKVWWFFGFRQESGVIKDHSCVNR